MFEKLNRWWHTRRVEPRIRRYGWTATYVGDYRSAPSWAYSIGFDETLDQPEVVIFDAPPADANRLLWEVFSELKTGALTLEDGAVWVEEDGHKSVWRQVHPKWIDCAAAWFAVAVLRRTGRTGEARGLRVFQLVLSDPAGFLPWDAGYDEALRPRQPALWDPRAPLAMADAV